VDELGSGVRNIYKYNIIYSGSDPKFIEGDVFKTIIPLTPQDTPQADAQDTTQATAQVDNQTRRILEFCKIPRIRSEIQEFLNLKHRENFRKNILNPLVNRGLLKLTIPDKPTSPKQKYYFRKIDKG
jgi:ATP-dependent DNA helicase RecG